MSTKIVSVAKAMKLRASLKKELAEMKHIIDREGVEELCIENESVISKSDATELCNEQFKTLCTERDNNPYPKYGAKNYGELAEIYLRKMLYLNGLTKKITAHSSQQREYLVEIDYLKDTILIYEELIQKLTGTHSCEPNVSVHGLGGKDEVTIKYKAEMEIRYPYIKMYGKTSDELALHFKTLIEKNKERIEELEDKISELDFTIKFEIEIED